MPEIDEFEKIAEKIECEHYCQRRPRGVNLRVRIAQAMREVHEMAVSNHRISLERIQRSLIGTLGICQAQCELNDRINAEFDSLKKSNS